MSGTSRPGSRRGTALLERREVLEPQPTSPGRARRLLRDALTAARRDDWVDAAELALSELVTNAALHAHTPIEVHVGVFDDEVYVEVLDRNPALPERRDSDGEATTGRGMGLVAAVATRCGIESLGPDGKVVWFCVSDGDRAVHADPAALLHAWDLDELAPPASPPSAPATVGVVLAGLPPTLCLSAARHHDTLLRELVLYLTDRPAVAVDLAAVDHARRTLSSALASALEAAERDGRSVPAVPPGHPSPLPSVPAELDVHVTVTPDAGTTFAALQDVLDLAEALAVDGELLARPGLPEIVAVRDWACEQVIAQLSGAPAAPWPGTAQERFETAVHDRADEDVPTWDTTVVAGSDRPVIAADEANRIIAVSDALAELLGWDVDELVGRRVVTVIPPSLREAHVAGFTRHLTTGESHVLGVPLDLPVLRRDGTELVCSFLVDRTAAPGGRAVYVAWLEPLQG